MSIRAAHSEACPIRGAHHGGKGHEAVRASHCLDRAVSNVNSYVHRLRSLHLVVLRKQKNGHPIPLTMDRVAVQLTT
jgi:hypothetical protein